MEQGWQACFEEGGIVEHARRAFGAAATRAAAAAKELGLVDAHHARALRRELTSLTKDDRSLDDRPTAPVGGGTSISASTIDVLLLSRFDRVTRVARTARFVARVIQDQPDIVFLHDDLEDTDVVAAAVIVHSHAPVSLVVILTDDDRVADRAARAGIASCSPMIDAYGLEELLAQLAA